MSDFFVGRQNAGTFTINLVPEKAWLQCGIWQVWQPIVHSVIACGRKQSFTITRRIGVSQTEKQSLEGAIEGSVGVAGVASVKSSVKGVLQQDVAWESEVSTSQNFEFEAPKCGCLTALVLQLVRSYDFRYEDRRWLHRNSWSTTITEHTIHIYDASKLVAWDERCECEQPNPGDFDGLLNMAVPPVAALVAYRRTSAHACELNLGGRSIPANFDPSQGFQASIRAEWLPPYLAFLIGESADAYNVTFTPYTEPSMELPVIRTEVQVAADLRYAPPYLER